MWKYLLATGKRSLGLEEWYVEIWSVQESRGTLPKYIDLARAESEALDNI